MKAFKPDGSRWYAPTATEVMASWLEQPELLDWLSRTYAPWELERSRGVRVWQRVLWLLSPRNWRGRL